MSKKENLEKNLEELSQIANWFEEREDIDLEEGLKKVKRAAEIIKKSRSKLKEIENQFKEVEKELQE